MTRLFDLYGNSPGMVQNTDTLEFIGHNLADVLQRAATWYSTNPSDNDRLIVSSSLISNTEAGTVRLTITTEPRVRSTPGQ